MSLLAALRESQTSVEFFTLLSRLESKQRRLDIQTEIISGHNGTGAYLQFIIEEHIYLDEQGNRILGHRIVHVFTLHQNGEIYWEMREKPLQIGLEVIQAELDDLAPILKGVNLPQYITIDNKTLPESPRSITELEARRH